LARRGTAERGLGFRVEFHLSDGTVIPGNDLVLLAGQAGRGYFLPRNSKQAYSILNKQANPEGFAGAVVHLKPSRSAALTNTKVRRYYPAEFRSPPIKFRLR
jgi:hypothetical protein